MGPVAPEPLETIACARCKQMYVPFGGFGICQPCADADAMPQGAQIGLFELAPTMPARTYKAPVAAQPEGLF